MSVESITAVVILVAWALVVYRVEGMKPRATRRTVIARHLVMGAALAIALVAPGAWGKLALAVGVLCAYLLSVQVPHVAPPARGGGQSATIIAVRPAPTAEARERDQVRAGAVVDDWRRSG